MGFGQEHGCVLQCFILFIVLFFVSISVLCTHTQWDVFQLYCSLDTQQNVFLVRPSVNCTLTVN